MYCTKCGVKNEEDAEVCSSCGVNLRLPRHKRRSHSGDGCFGSSQKKDDCFGLPFGGAIAGIVFGCIIVFIGLAIASGLNVWNYLWPFVIIVVGVLIVAGAIYGMRRER